MTGIIGEKPFKDYSIGERVRGGGMIGISEYGGTTGWTTPSGMHAFGGEEPSVLARLGTTMLNRLRSTAGMPTTVEIGNAARVKDEAHASERIDQRAAAAVADRLSVRSDDEVRRALPGDQMRQLPRQEDLRWAAIATRAIDVIHQHVDHGDDHRLSPQLARANRVSSLIDLRSTQFEGDLSKALDGMAATSAGHVRNYLARDAAIDNHVAAQHERMREQGISPALKPERETRDRAEARMGLMDPHEIVHRANVFGATHGLDPERSRTAPMPDFRNLRSTPEQAERLVQSELTRPDPGKQYANGPVDPAPSPKQEVKDVGADIRALHAARAASLGNGNGR